MKRVISIILTAVFAFGAALPASAKTWITLSSWAYTDVSNYRKDGLLPQSMDGISDYTTEINRLQFAEILYNSLYKSRMINQNNYIHGFLDIKHVAATALKNQNIIEGEFVSEDEYGNKEYNFNPDKKLTREEMAAMLYRTIDRFAKGLLTAMSIVPADSDKVSDWAKEAVGAVLGSQVMLGRDGGNFDPQGTLTIEQAIVSVYRLYQMYPTAPNADGAGIRTNTETFIQSYENGMTETIKGNILYIKSGDNALMEFETDIYSCIDAVTVNGKNYAVAQHCNKKTDVYDMAEKKILFSIPYPFSFADGEYIVTESSDIGPMTFGLYDYSGKEILEPKYSYSEIETLKANNFEPQKEAYRAPDGWYYYADWHDKGHLYKVDTNGENKQKLSDRDCFNIKYINGWLYYSVRGEDEGKLFCVREDGKYEQQITEFDGSLLVRDDTRLNLVDEIKDQSENIYKGVWFSSYGGADDEYIYDDEWVYYIASHTDDERSDGSIYRIRFTEDGKAVKECISGDVKLRNVGYGAEALYNDGTIYFMSNNSWYVENQTHVPESIYSYKDGELKKISKDKDVSNFGFYKGRLAFSVITSRYEPQFEEDYSYITGMEVYIFDENCESFEILEEAKPYIEGKLAEGKGGHDYWLENRDNTNSRDDYADDTEDLPEEYVMENYSDERFTVFYDYEWKKIGEEEGMAGGPKNLCVRDADGKETVLCGTNEWEGGLRRIDDILYYMQNSYNNGHTGKILVAYNLNTGDKKQIADDVKNIWSYAREDDKFILVTDTNLNIVRYDINEDKCTALFPNSNSNKYGKLYYLTGMANMEGIYKVDVDGNISTVTDTLAMYGQYVPNGAQTGSRGDWYELYGRNDE